MMHVILSQPKPVEVSLAINQSRSLSIILFIGTHWYNYSRTNLIISSLFFVSQIPSHPRIMNSSSLLSFLVIKSGTAIIFCSSYESSGSFLYSKSPIQRERFRFPSILPSETKPFKQLKHLESVKTSCFGYS